MCSIAIHGIHVEVRAVRLGGETVIVDVYPGPLDIHTRCIHRVHEIGIFGDNTPIVGKSCRYYIVVTDIVRTDDEVIPARRVLEMNARDLQIGSVLGVKQDRSIVLIIGIENPRIIMSFQHKALPCHDNDSKLTSQSPSQIRSTSVA